MTTHTLRMLALASLLALACWRSSAQGSAGTEASYEPRSVIDLPTAGVLPGGTVALDMEFFKHDGLLAVTSIGLFDRLVLAISYGGANILGTETPVWNPAPGVALRVRVIDETLLLPAIAVGFDSQGKEEYIDRLSRYTVKSLGLYAVASKNYSLLGFLSLHGGINYSFERADGDDDPNLFLAAEKSVGPVISLLGEYNLGANDSNHDALGRGRGYLNLGLRAAVGKGFSVGIALKDIAKNQQEISIGNRTFSLEYLQSL
jgi:hypothetical protein